MVPKNQMTIEQCKMAFPKSSWFGADKSPTGKALVPEESLQTYANQALWLRHWSYIRFPNYLLYWMKYNAPKNVRIMFFNICGGKLPDNLIMIPVAPGCFLSVKLELKTQDKHGRMVGRLHGKQKRYANAEGWYVARSPEQINKVLDEISTMAEIVKKELNKNKLKNI